MINLLNFNIKTSGDATSIGSGSISNFKFFTTYIYLEEEEEVRIRNALPAEYLIETITRTGPVTSSSTISGLTTVSLHNGGGIDKTRGSVGATLDYFVAKDARISFHSNYQELRYHNSDSENFYISYALGF